MSRAIRKRLLETIELLKQGTKAVGDLIAKGCSEDSYTLLEDCQQLAIALGTHIEKLKGEGTSVVTELEKYCESIYQIGLLLNQQQSVEDACKKLCEQSRKVQDMFEQEISDKKEIVFLPYKASMWDSLESVWMAADKDPDCDAYVIPIPYYNKNSDGSFGELHYEGDLYPDYVPVTDYREYDLEERHPDIIYVHNPYDEFNKVTSVAPEFYLKKIKDYTDKLVYIPYFVLSEIDPDNQEAIDEMSHFCFLPGTMYADEVILQSENMCQIYVNEFIKAAKERGMTVDREKIEKKFLGLGSPKFERVVNTKKENAQIPDEWRRIIQKPDGSWKKIIFYNTSVTALLQNSEQMLAKMRDVFRVFQENQDEVALLWRPHPLIKETMESMLPHLRMEYELLVQQYRNAGWGIYDDTPDVERAIVLSDAYYGDRSSVVQMCQKRGMPIMIQNVEVTIG